MVLTPKSFTELPGAHLCVFTPHPYSICLLSSLVHNRYSVLTESSLLECDDAPLLN